MAGAGQQLLQILPEAQLVAGDLEGVAEEERAPQPQEHLGRQLVPQRPALLGAQCLRASCTGHAQPALLRRSKLC